MYGLVELDVTEARRRLAAQDPPLSFTAYVIACVARAAAAHPEVHAYRDWRGRLVVHSHVDLSTFVEIATPEGPFPLAHIVHDADVRSVADLTTELRAVRARPREHSHGLLGGYGAVRTFVRLPGLVPLTYAAMSRSVRVRQRVGTVSVTSLAMFADTPFFGLSPPALMTLGVTVGGIGQRARLVDGELKAREVVDITVMIDHNVVDGGPAARFGAEFSRLVETAPLLDES